MHTEFYEPGRIERVLKKIIKYFESCYPKGRLALLNLGSTVSTIKQFPLSNTCITPQKVDIIK